MSVDIKDCPFCGGKASIFTEKYDGETVYMVCCEECGICTAAYEYEQPAINDWNRRVA